jgi:DNA-binding transcriptional regulator YiaG
MARTTPANALNVRETRAKMGLSRERFGHLLDVSAKTIERWLDGLAASGSAQGDR